MQLLSVLMPLVGLVCFVAYIWMVVTAFRNSVLWGVLVLLFSPITAIIFAVKNWEEAKKPFLAYIGSTAACVAVMVMFVMSIGMPMVQMAKQMSEGEVTDEQAAQFFESHIETMEKSGLLNEQDKAELQKMKGMIREASRQDETETRPAPEPATDAPALSAALDPARTTPQPRTGTATVSVAAQPSSVKTTPPKDYRTRDVVYLRDIDDHVGERLRVVMTDGGELTGRYVGRKGDDLQFARRLSSGSMDVWIGEDEVQSLHVVKSR